MAGAGYKLFTTGSVLTASEVNTYLQEQTVMVFADAAARTTALSGVLAEGMVSYLKSTKVVEIYNGTAWASLDDPNAIQNTIVDAKGDLITATGNDVPARLAVGNNGETLVADSASSVGLRWQADFAAGKNKIINGDFNINQRAFTSSTANGVYGFDRWKANGTTFTYNTQAFTAGTAPVTGYEAKNFARLVSTSQSTADDSAAIRQPIEDVRTLANQTAIVSFWAKASSGTPTIGVTLQQTFGTGGSSSVKNNATNQTITTSWTRYSFPISVASISGKTIGTDSSLDLYILTSVGSNIAAFGYPAVGLQNATIDIWGVQVEAGSVATAFQTATGTLAGELAACQRYYFRMKGDSNNSTYGMGYARNSTTAVFPIPMKQTMRVEPTSIDYSTLRVASYGATPQTITSLTFDGVHCGPDYMMLVATVASGLTALAPYDLSNDGSANGYVGFNAEL